MNKLHGRTEILDVLAGLSSVTNEANDLSDPCRARLILTVAVFVETYKGVEFVLE